jgi:hypothetical protein
MDMGPKSMQITWERCITRGCLAPAWSLWGARIASPVLPTPRLLLGGAGGRRASLCSLFLFFHPS